MKYFENFDYIKYDFTIKTDAAPMVETIVDITQRVELKITPENMDELCNEYIIPDGIKPEQMAASLYDDPHLHWTILYINNISNLYAQWPISSKVLNDFVTKKYGAGNEYDVHHYEKMPERLVMDYQFIIDTYGETPQTVTNFDHEYTINELKRYIKVIKPIHISTFVSAFQKAKING